jgi:hypothetical protein
MMASGTDWASAWFTPHGEHIEKTAINNEQAKGW